MKRRDHDGDRYDTRAEALEAFANGDYDERWVRVMRMHVPGCSCDGARDCHSTLVQDFDPIQQMRRVLGIE